MPSIYNGRSLQRKLHSLKLTHKCLHSVGPTYLHHKFRYTSDVSSISTRGSNSGKLYLNRPRTEFYRKSFEYSTGRLWNSLPSNIRALDSLVTFTNACRRILHSFWICVHGFVIFVCCFSVAFLFYRCIYAGLIWKSAM